MNALLDTHSFLWWNLDDTKLSQTVKNIIADANNEIFLSAASGWEISIKYARGRLPLPEPPDRYVATRMAHYHFLPLPIQLSHALHGFNLPAIHQDPFDRILIAQAQLENLPLLSADEEIAQYAVEVIW